MTSRSRAELVDQAMDVYVDWREECAGVARAYERWASVPDSDRDVAFAAYRAALDREEQASCVYRERVDRVTEAIDPPRQRDWQPKTQLAAKT